MYDNRKRADAMRHLVLNLGDVDLTHRQTNISKSTLHRWKNILKSNKNILYWEQDSKTVIVHRQYDGIRDIMLTQIRRLLEQMHYYGPEYATDYANAVARLTDRIVKIEGLLELTGQYSIVVDLRHPQAEEITTEKGQQRNQRLTDADPQQD